MKMSGLVRSLVAAAIVSATGSVIQAGMPAEAPPPAASAAAGGVFTLNEELTYEVTYMSIPLGSIRILTTHQDGEGDRAMFTTKADVRSYSGVPFVRIREIDESTMNRAAIPAAFQAREQMDEKWKVVNYTFDQQAHRLIARESFADSEHGTTMEPGKIDTFTIRKNCVDGLSLLYFARVNALSSRGRAEVPTFLKGKEGTTIINFERKVTEEEIDAVDYPVDVVEIGGEAQVSGILGMSGEYTGWFSNDMAGVPIKGKVKIFLGSITIELKKWKRPDGWMPPHAPSGR